MNTRWILHWWSYLRNNNKVTLLDYLRQNSDDGLVTCTPVSLYPTHTPHRTLGVFIPSLSSTTDLFWVELRISPFQ